MSANVYYTPSVATNLGLAPVPAEVWDWHRRLPGYAPTPLHAAPALARLLGVGQVWVKDESCRLGLPAFKILGASWAVYCALQQRLGHALAPWASLDDLAAQLAPLRPLTLAAATDGNHGRAVARMAALLGLEAHILVPAGTAQARLQAIAEEGARLTVVAGSYDDAVGLAAQQAGPHCLVISDTAWPGYEETPRWVIEGYSTILHELDQQLAQAGAPGLDLVAVQIGVGALAAGVLQHYRQSSASARPAVVGVEPSRAACVLTSLHAGQIVTLPGLQDSIMAGLNCGTPSSIAWPLLCQGLNCVVAVEDEWARQAMRALADAGIVAGETGAAGLAGLLALLTDAEAGRHRAALDLGQSSQVLILVTEGATDPDAYVQIVGRSPAEISAAGCV